MFSEVRAVRKDRTEFDCEMSISEVLGPPDRPRIFTIVMRDITERKKAQEAEAKAARIAELEREVRSLEKLSGASPAYVTGEMYGIKPLRQSAPDVFKTMAQRYSHLLDLTMEQHAYKVEHDISGELTALADRLGSFRAGPRDVVDMHLAAVESRTKGAGPEKVRSYALEGRLLAMELMGHLVEFYRRAPNLPGALEEKEVPT